MELAKQRYLKPGQGFNAQQQAQMYYARKRQRARAELTAGHHGGMREVNRQFGVRVSVVLTVQ